VTEATPLDQFVGLLLESHEVTVAQRSANLARRWAEERAQRRMVAVYVEMAETDRRTARSTVRRLGRQLFLLDDRAGGVLDRANIEPVAHALVRRSLGVRDDAAVEDAEVTYALIEDVRRQIPIAYSWRRAKDAEPGDEEMRTLERELDVLERRYTEIWVAWVAR